MVFRPAQVWTGSDWDDIGDKRLKGAYAFRETVYFTSNGTFTKADYPWLRAIRVRVVGGGGGGGGAATTSSNQTANAEGGPGGVYAESFITNIAGLSASVTVTVGSGGSGGSAGANNGAAGGNSSFGSTVSAFGGGGGVGSAATNNTNVVGTTNPSLGGVGDLVIPGGRSRNNLTAMGGSFDEFRSLSGGGGDSVYGVGGAGRTNNGNGADGNGKGGGGAGALNAQSQGTARSGGAGTAGLVIVELFA
jgi:hypothetical protein